MIEIDVEGRRTYGLSFNKLRAKIHVYLWPSTSHAFSHDRFDINLTV